MIKHKFIKVSIVLSLVLLFSFISIAADAQDKVFITMPTATVGGSYYAAGTVIANLWNEKLRDEYNIIATAQSSKGSIENIEMLKNNEGEVAILNSSVYIPAYMGIDSFENNAFEDLRFITMLWANPMQLVAKEDSGVDELNDLKGMRVSVGSPGSTSPITEIMFYGADMTFDDFQAEFLGFDQSVQAMKDGKIDAAQLSGAIPHPSVLDLFSSRLGVKLISMKDEEIKKAIEAYPYVNPFVIPKDTYPNQDYDVKTAAVTTILAVREDVDEEIVYLLTKTIFENLDELAAAYDGLSTTSLETAFAGFSVPLHEGAIRYYKEIGMEIPEEVLSK